MRAEEMSLPGQLLMKLDIVVDLAVETNREGPVLVVDWLPSSIEVDDREPLHAHEEAMRQVFARALPVGPPMNQTVSHPGQKSLVKKT
jgi:hypothetical protein